MNTKTFTRNMDVSKLVLGGVLTAMFAGVLALAGWVGTAAVDTQTKLECQELKIKHNQELIKELKNNSKKILEIVREIQRDLYSQGIGVKYTEGR